MRRTLVAPLIGLTLTLVYAALVQPAWEPQLNDQLQYLSLARGIVERGEFTRAVGLETFFPETYRLPGYPLLLAPTCLGGCDHWRIAIVQGLLVAALVYTAAVLARRIAPRSASAAAIATAAFLPFAYYGSLALSDLPGAALFGLALVAWVRALDRKLAWLAFAAGALFGWAALMRGVLLFAPVALAVVALMHDRRHIRFAAAALAATALVVMPYVAYSASTFGRTSGGTSGLVLFYGALQGRSEASLDELEREQIEAARADVAAFEAIEDRAAKARAWPPLDDTLGGRGRALIAHDPLGWVLRGAIRVIELWTGERPIPGGASGDLAAVLSAIQLVLVLAAAGGTVLLARSRDPAATAIAVVVAYVTLTALPFQTEARYALPAKMPAIVAAVVFIDWWFERRRARAARVAARPTGPPARGG